MQNKHGKRNRLRYSLALVGLLTWSPSAGATENLLDPENQAAATPDQGFLTFGVSGLILGQEGTYASRVGLGLPLPQKWSQPMVLQLLWTRSAATVLDPGHPAAQNIDELTMNTWTLVAQYSLWNWAQRSSLGLSGESGYGDLRTLGQLRSKDRAYVPWATGIYSDFAMSSKWSLVLEAGYRGGIGLEAPDLDLSDVQSPYASLLMRWRP